MIEDKNIKIKIFDKDVYIDKNSKSIAWKSSDGVEYRFSIENKTQEQIQQEVNFTNKNQN